MTEKLNLDFLLKKPIYPHSFHSGWIAALRERCPNPTAWTYHIKFRVYKTKKNFAVQFSHGIGGKGNPSPNGWSNSDPIYKKDLDKLWSSIFNHIEYCNANVNAVETKLKNVLEFET